MRGDVAVRVLESAYALDSDDARWLAGLAKETRPLLDRGFGSFVWRFDANDFVRSAKDPAAYAGDARLLSQILVGVGPNVPAEMLHGALLASDSEVAPTSERFLGGRGFDELVPLGLRPKPRPEGDPSHVHAERRVVQDPTFLEVVKKSGARDFFAVRCSTPTGTGCLIGGFSDALIHVPRNQRETWACIRAHVAAALRLRAAIDTLPAEAIFSPDGALLHAEGPAKLRQRRLAAHVRSVERARTRRVRSNPTEALALWRVLADARWSVVERFESDGRRLLVALPNEVVADDPRRMTAREASVARLLADGESNKRIAYALGVAEGNISSCVASLRRKLRAKSRAELVDLLRTPVTAVQTGLDAESVVVFRGEEACLGALAPLTVAEREVALAAARGASDADIAVARGCSRRTVTTLLSSVYRRLEIRSRAELVVLLRP